MNYSEMLNRLINDSGKMLKDICSDCRQYGVELNPTYLSVIKRDPTRVASPELSRAIAKACGAKHSEVLIVQACLDKAPEVMIEFLEGIRALMNTGLNASKLFMGEHDAITEELEEIKEAPLAEFICEYADQLKQDAENMQSELMQAQQKPQEPRWLAIPPELVKQLVFINDSDIKKRD